MPECYKQFMEIAMKLENHYRDMQDMEFTIQEGKLFFLQTRNGKRTAPAAIQIACDLVDEGMITPEEAVCRIEAKSLDQLLASDLRCCCAEGRRGNRFRTAGIPGRCCR